MTVCVDDDAKRLEFVEQAESAAWLQVDQLRSAAEQSAEQQRSTEAQLRDTRAELAAAQQQLARAANARDDLHRDLAHRMEALQAAQAEAAQLQDQHGSDARALAELQERCVAVCSTFFVTLRLASLHAR